MGTIRKNNIPSPFSFGRHTAWAAQPQCHPIRLLRASLLGILTVITRGKLNTACIGLTLAEDNIQLGLLHTT